MFNHLYCIDEQLSWLHNASLDGHNAYSIFSKKGQGAKIKMSRVNFLESLPIYFNRFIDYISFLSKYFELVYFFLSRNATELRVDFVICRMTI